jgi:hypothetical protein
VAEIVERAPEAVEEIVDQVGTSTAHALTSERSGAGSGTGEGDGNHVETEVIADGEPVE